MKSEEAEDEKESLRVQGPFKGVIGGYIGIYGDYIRVQGPK